VLGYEAFGPCKQEFYELLCNAKAPKSEALYEALRELISKMNIRLPGAKRMCARCARF
jgi:hypothetical protein